MRYRPELDGIRALAISAAVLSHTVVPYTGGGWMGVDVFFVLSGFLITTILVDEWNRTGIIRLGSFYLRRALRLYPALLLMLAIGVLFYRYLGNNGTLAGYRTTALFGATYTEDFVLGITGQPYGQLGHTWSLAIEEQFYLLWAPILLISLKMRRSPVPIACIAILASSLSLILTSKPNPATGLPNAYYRPDTHANELMLGCLISFIVSRYGEKIRKFAVPGLLAPISLFGLLLLGFYSNFHGRQFLYPQEELGTALLAGGLLIGVILAPRRAPLNFLLRLPPIVWLGKISYGIYIFFIPIFWILPAYWHESDPHLFVPGELACVVLVATMSYYLWERPFLALKKRLATSSSSRKSTWVPPRSRSGDGAFLAQAAVEDRP